MAVASGRPAPTVQDDGRKRFPPHRRRESKVRIGQLVTGSLATGLVVAALLVAAPVTPPTEPAVTAALLCGWALGWAMLAAGSLLFTDQPQRWAAAPALFMAVSGLLLMVLGSPALEVLTWVWPPTLMALVVWALTRAHRALRSRTRRWVVYPTLAILAAASVTGGYQTVRAAAEAAADPIPGRLVDVGGHRLHLHCTGTGSPTVVLEPGAGLASSDLDLIAPVVARDTRVCVYDRAGRGWSEPADPVADHPQDATQIATDLHTLLHSGHVPGPYVLAGHSFGGLYTLTYAAQYPDEVAGMVLIDSTSPASDPVPSRPPAQGASNLPGRVSALVSASARLGVGRLVGTPTADYMRSTIDEYVQGNASMSEAAALRDFTDKPLIVLEAGNGHDADWSAAQDAMATLSTNSLHRVVDGVDHGGLLGDVNGATATAAAILDVVTSARAGQPLAE